MENLMSLNYNTSDKMIYEYQPMGYTLDNNLNQDDSDLMDGFNDFDGSTNIGDAISEIADNGVGIYNSDICENCWNLYSSGAYEEAFDNGLIGESSNNLISNLQSAWYQYNSQQLYNNFKELIYNYAIGYIEGNLKYLTYEEFEDIKSELDIIDNNNCFSDITDIVDDVIANRN